jgi:hypothetical protein
METTKTNTKAADFAKRQRNTWRKRASTDQKRLQEMLEHVIMRRENLISGPWKMKLSYCGYTETMAIGKSLVCVLTVPGLSAYKETLVK